MASPVVRHARSLVPSTLLLALTLASSLAFPLLAPDARAVEERIWVSAGPGGAFYDPEQVLKDTYGIGVEAAGFVNRWIGVEGTFLQSSPTIEDPYGGDASFTHFGAGVIVTPDRYRWNIPYLTLGVGSVSADNAFGESKSYGARHIGGGIVVRAGERLGFRLDGRNISYEQEGGPGRDTRVNTIFVSGSVTAFWMGRPRDTDSDGVPDKRDKSPATPAGAVVDATGTPLDTDKDGVFDGLDKSPATPLGAKVTAEGVAIDSDGDGVADGVDVCDSTAAGILVDAKGCGLDTDGDKVFDGLDKCAATPVGAVVDSSGCPVDADADGVADGIDICPYTPSGVTVNVGGCPITLTPYERDLLDNWMIRVTDLAFAPDSARLLPSATATLDSIGQALVQWPEAKIEIGVHVDDVPEPGYRIPLSQMRVRAVLQHLLQKYPMLNQKNFWVTGYGDTEPLVPNTSTANRARNRRVEFRVMNMNVLQQEMQRRQSFGSTPPPSPAGGDPTPPAPTEG